MIHVSSAVFLGNEKKYVEDCLSTTRLTQGKYVKLLEEKFAELAGVKYAIACSSGTAALHLALLTVGVEEGDLVAVPALTYIATANAVTYCGGIPVFVDVDPTTWCMKPGELPTKYSFIVPVHLYGYIEDWSNINTVYYKDCNYKPVVEDCAQTSIPKLQGKIATYSFYASKIIAAGEGGMVVTNDEWSANNIRILRGQGVDSKLEVSHYYHTRIGYNYRMTEMAAAVALAQVETFRTHIGKRAELADIYRQSLGSWVTFQPSSSNWIMPVLLPDRGSNFTNEVVDKLLEAEIETRPFFTPIPSLPPYFDRFPTRDTSCPVADNLHRRGICLPLHSGLTPKDIVYICNNLLGML